MKQLLSLITELENNASNLHKVKTSVSSSTVGWQIEHSLLVIIQIIKASQKSNPDEYVWRFNFSRILLTLTAKIPRGKVQAPKQVQPSIEVTQQSIAHHIQLAKTGLTELEKIHPNCFFKHPYIGGLNVKNTISFLKIHTKHHLNIINDIVV